MSSKRGFTGFGLAPWVREGKPCHPQGWSGPGATTAWYDRQLIAYFDSLIAAEISPEGEYEYDRYLRLKSDKKA